MAINTRFYNIHKKPIPNSLKAFFSCMILLFILVLSLGGCSNPDSLEEQLKKDYGAEKISIEYFDQNSGAFEVETLLVTVYKSGITKLPNNEFEEATESIARFVVQNYDDLGETKLIMVTIDDSEGSFSSGNYSVQQSIRYFDVDNLKEN